jgi:hypothetical protein
MSVMDDLRPIEKLRVMDLLSRAGIEVAHWKDFKGKNPATNPKYCYNWAFEQPGELIALCLWHNSIQERDGRVFFHRLPREYSTDRPVPGAVMWNLRDSEFATGLETAYRQQLPIRVIVVDGKRRNADDEVPVASSVEARLLDPAPWAITEFNEATQECIIERGAVPSLLPLDPPDYELSYFEGRRRRAFVNHRVREGKARRDKIKEALRINEGRLVCEVPGCGFDFLAQYGPLGDGYAQVHHLTPLNKAPNDGRATKLSDLAIVCANCHVMIHKGGECRPLLGLISAPMATTRRS